MAKRPLAIRLGWTARDYAKRVWDNSGEDNIFFLAGGIAFNILLAVVPFFLLLVTGLVFFLNQSADASTTEVTLLIDRLLPPNPATGASAVHDALNDISKARGSIGIWSAITFVWFSTRLFGSLRSVLAEVFDIEQDRGMVDGKLFDVKLTIVSTALIIAYTVVSAYLAIATTRGIAMLQATGLRQEIMGGLEYSLGRLFGFTLIAAMFYGLYKYLPNRRVRWQTAMCGALVTSTLFEIARNLFTRFVQSFNPGSLYTATLSSIIIVVFWVYYSGLIFIIGGEVAQVYELRRVRRMQRETFEE